MLWQGRINNKNYDLHNLKRKKDPAVAGFLLWAGLGKFVTAIQQIIIGHDIISSIDMTKFQVAGLKNIADHGMIWGKEGCYVL